MKQLTFLVAPICAVGHVNACVGIGLPLLRRGHRVVFFLDEPYRGKLVEKGFEEYIYTLNTQKKNGENDPNPAKQLAIDLLENKIIGPSPIREKLANLNKFFVESEISQNVVIQSNGFMKDAIAKIKPDCFLVDNGYLLPAIYYSGIPWVFNISCVPLFYIEHDDVPPGGFGEI